MVSNNQNAALHADPKGIHDNFPLGSMCVKSCSKTACQIIVYSLLIGCHAVGPGDARPTAAAIVRDEGMVGKLGGKVILITGCSSGIGIETARALLATGAHVFVTARDVAKGQAVVQDLLGSSNGTGQISLLSLDLTSLKSVRACASEFLQKSQQLNILITNAGRKA